MEGNNINLGHRIEPDERIRIMLEEYAALEKRSQNDSVVGYALVGAILLASLTLLNMAAELVANGSTVNKTLLVILAVASVSSLFVSRWILARFRRAGDIRIARCVQIERELGMRSFMLFPPWLRGDEEYYALLGQLLERNQIDMSVPDQQRFFVQTGNAAVSNFNKHWRVTTLFDILIYTMSFIWFVLVVVQWTMG